MATSVGFIGVGNMGNPMASNVLKAGFPMIVYDRNPQAMESLLPLLAQILTQLEAQTPPAKPAIATYRDLYDEPTAGPPEGELVAAALAPPADGRWVVRWARWLGVVQP